MQPLGKMLGLKTILYLQAYVIIKDIKSWFHHSTDENSKMCQISLSTLVKT